MFYVFTSESCYASSIHKKLSITISTSCLLYKKMSRSIQIFYLFMYLGSASAALHGASSSKCPVSDIDYQNALSVQEKILNRLESDADQFESMLYTHCSKASIQQFHREYTRHLEELILLQMERKRWPARISSAAIFLGSVDQF